MSNLTFRQFFRLTFVCFTLYLLGDVFYRWDGFKFHSGFSEFLPSVALAFIIWSIIALLTALLTWLILKTLELFFKCTKLKISTGHMLLYSSIFVVLLTLSWIIKKLIWSDLQTSMQLKLTVISLMSAAAIPFTWLVRANTGRWLTGLQERITPLVWLFGIFIAFSVLLTGYQLLGKEPAAVVPVEHTPASVTDKKRPNILFVSFDALTARKMSAFGYSRPTTPFIKKWAKKASLFTRTKAESNYTTATTASMMTGKKVWTHRKYQHDMAAKPVRITTENLPLILKENGYFNAAFIANIITSVESVGISHSFDIAPSVTEFTKPVSIESIIEQKLFMLFGNKFHIHNWIGQDDFIFTILLRRLPQRVFTTEHPPELSFDKFLETMDGTPQSPFFAWIHILPPHDPLLPPLPFAGTFSSSDELREMNIAYSIRPEIKKYSENDLPYPKETQRKVDLFRDYYDEFILYCDRQFEEFIGKMQKRNWSKNTIIILSADHGDSFEHGYFLHNGPHLYEQVTHIPLIIKWPDQTDGLVINDLVEQVDIPATILDLAGIPVPSWMEGRSVQPLMRGGQLPPKTAVSVNLFRNPPADPITKGSVAVWEYDYKMIYYFSDKPPLLFNLKEDPDELNNLFNKEPATAQRLLTVIKDKIRDANKRIALEKNEIAD